MSFSAYQAKWLTQQKRLRKSLARLAEKRSTISIHRVDQEMPNGDRVILSIESPPAHPLPKLQHSASTPLSVAKIRAEPPKDPTIRLELERRAASFMPQPPQPPPSHREIPRVIQRDEED